MKRGSPAVAFGLAFAIIGALLLFVLSQSGTTYKANQDFVVNAGHSFTIHAQNGNGTTTDHKIKFISLTAGFRVVSSNTPCGPLAPVPAGIYMCGANMLFVYSSTSETQMHITPYFDTTLY